MEKVYSAWGVNQFGVLYYSGLSTNVNTLTLDDHNPIELRRQYEVWAVNEYGLVHGIVSCEKHGYTAILVRNCWLMGKKINKEK